MPIALLAWTLGLLFRSTASASGSQVIKSVSDNPGRYSTGSRSVGREASGMLKQPNIPKTILAKFKHYSVGTPGKLDDARLCPKC
jgi:hypothetical protein